MGTSLTGTQETFVAQKALLCRLEGFLEESLGRACDSAPEEAIVPTVPSPGTKGATLEVKASRGSLRCRRRSTRSPDLLT
jgi:hypothetical protein